MNTEMINIIKSYIEKNRYNQNIIAECLGISQTAVSALLNGKMNLKPEYIEKLITFLDIVPEDANRLRILYWKTMTGKNVENIFYSGKEFPGNIIHNTPELREKIKDAMIEQKIDYQQLAQKTGYDKPSTIKRLLDGKLEWFPSMLSAVCNALNIEFDILPITPQERMLLSSAYDNTTMQTRPVFVYTLAEASTALLKDGFIEPKNQWELETIPMPIDGREYVAFRIDGQSMEPKLNDGDIVICDKDAPINNRDIIVCRLQDNNVICKQYNQVDNNKIYLTSINPSGQNFCIDKKDIVWIVKAIKKIGEL